LTRHGLYYEAFGDPLAPPLVFLHGFMGDGRDWDAVVSPLSRRHYCLTIDLPGHGKSLGLGGDMASVVPYTLAGAVAGIIGVLRREDVIPATVIGYSMGGRIALCLATRYPEACCRLVIESATAGIVDPQERRKRRRYDDALVRQLKNEGLPAFLHRWYQQPIFKTIAESPSMLKEVIRRRSRNNPFELAKGLAGMSVGEQESLWEALAGLHIPVLLLVGERDEKYVNIAQAMGAALSFSTVKIVPASGHTAHLEDPSTVAREIERFLQRNG
jgi:2-succinyl-6-hydroxy-2,4-cyclohexadiene-1-carboxylate synthase